MPQTISAGMARRFAEALASSAAALWLVDVLVNLGLAGATVRGEFSLAGPRDFLGLLAAESPFAIATAAFAVVGATIVAARSRQGAGRELVVLLPASATALVVAGRFAWPFDASRIGIAVFAAATAGLFSLWLLRRWSTRTSESELSLSVRFGAATGLPVLGAFTARIAVEADPLPAAGAALVSGAAFSLGVGEAPGAAGLPDGRCRR